MAPAKAQNVSRKGTILGQVIGKNTELVKESYRFQGKIPVKAQISARRVRGSAIWHQQKLRICQGNAVEGSAPIWGNGTSKSSERVKISYRFGERHESSGITSKIRGTGTCDVKVHVIYRSKAIPAPVLRQLTQGLVRWHFCRWRRER